MREREREREVTKQFREPRPGETLTLAPTAEPLVPGPLRLFENAQSRLHLLLEPEVQHGVQIDVR